MLDIGINGLFDQIGRDVVFGLVTDLGRNSSVSDSLGVLFAFLVAVVDGFILTSPLFGEVEPRAKRPGALIGVMTATRFESQLRILGVGAFYDDISTWISTQNAVYMIESRTAFTAILLPIFDTQFFIRAISQKSRCFTKQS